jgi:hypothetical protein
MIVHVASFLESIGGSIDEEHWLRPIPGRPGYAAYCRKPQYTQKQKKEMAEHPTAKAFSSLCKRASAIMRDEAQKAEWTAKHLAAKREASKHQRLPQANGKPAVPERLWDYIRHELSKQK